MKTDPTEGWLSKLKDDCGSEYIDCRRHRAFWESVVVHANNAIKEINQGMIDGAFNSAKKFSEIRGKSISQSYEHFIGQYRQKETD